MRHLPTRPESSSGVRTVTFATAQPVCSRPWTPKTGDLIGKVQRRHRTAEFCSFLDTNESCVPADLVIHLILDNVSANKPG